MNVRDEWYYFNGVRWERTLEGTLLRMSIHNKIWKIYHEYEETKYNVAKSNEIYTLNLLLSESSQNQKSFQLNLVHHTMYSDKFREFFSILDVDL